MVQWLELETLNQAIRDEISVEHNFILICNETNTLKSFKSLQLAQFYLFNNFAVRYYGVMVSTQDSDSCYCLLYTSPSPRDLSTSRMPSSA